MNHWIRNALVGLSLLAGSLGSAKPKPAAAVVPNPAVSGNNHFAFDLYAQLSREQGNLFLSPYSISTALAMTYAGARGQTAQAMAKTLHFPADRQQLHAAFTDLVHTLQNPDKKPNYQLQIANALWGQKNFQFLKSFLQEVEDSYGGGLRTLDFAASEEARQTINRWVGEQTKEKIKDLLKPGDIDVRTRLVLTNAIYFKAAWSEPLNAKLTQPEDFHVSNAKKIRVSMMHQQNHFPYVDAGSFQLLELPYEKGDLSMLVLLPKKIDGLTELEKGLTASELDKWLSKRRSQQVDVALPRFKFTKRFELRKTLSAMGMAAAFSGQADFSGMTGQRDLFIHEAIHQAFVAVNEEGTEAAAATAIVMRLAAAPPTERIAFRADHPFVFVIRDNHTGSILFLGRVAQPEV